MVTKEIASWEPTDSDLDSIDTFQDYAELLRKNNTELSDANEVLAGGWQKVDKADLVGVPFIIAKWKDVVDESTGRPYAHIRVVTTDNRKLWFNDGSTGIYAQLTKMFEDTGKAHGIFCRHGLSRSDYVKEIDGKKEKATTFYVDVS